MLKNVFLTMFMDKKAMKEVNSYRNSFFIASIIGIFIFQVVLNFLWLQVTDKESISIVGLIIAMLIKEVLWILFSILFGFVLWKGHAKNPNLIFKMIVSMNFIRLITGIVSFLNMFVNISTVLALLVIVYDYFFAVNYMKANLEPELPEKTVKRYILDSFILTFVLLFLMYGISILIMGTTGTLLKSLISLKN
ncbi:MAG: hypothetical protein IKK38_07730 [Spirochaetaceae bacterium]|nr:hypothetical protein [Spirochaetaceae bacterium]